MEKREIRLTVKSTDAGLLSFQFEGRPPERWPFAGPPEAIHLGPVPSWEETSRGLRPDFAFLLKLARCPGLQLAPCFIRKDGFSVSPNEIEDRQVLIGHLVEIVQSELREDEVLRTDIRDPSPTA